MTVRVVGLFRELERTTRELPSLRESVDSLDQETAARVANYLGAGEPVVDVMGISRDPIDARTIISGGPSLETDGEWVWRADLKYFVEKYRVQLPDEFIEHVNAQSGVTLSAEERRNLPIRWQEFSDAFENSLKDP